MWILATKLWRTSWDETRSSIAQTTQEPGKIAKFASDFYETWIKPSTKILWNTLKTVVTAPIDIWKDIAKWAENLWADISKWLKWEIWKDTWIPLWWFWRTMENTMWTQKEMKDIWEAYWRWEITKERALLQNMWMQWLLLSDTLWDVFMSWLKTIFPNEWEQAAKELAQWALSTETGQKISNKIEETKKEYKRLKEIDPNKARDYKAGLGWLSLWWEVSWYWSVSKTAKWIKEWVEEWIEKAIKTGITAKQTWKNLTKTLVENIPENFRTIKPWQVVENIWQQTDNVSENLLTKLQNRALENKWIQAEDAARKIIQWDTKDIAPAVQTFEKLDLTDVNDYKWLSNKVDEQLWNIVKTQDDILRAKWDVLNIEDATKNIKTSKWDITTNPIKNAINDIDEVIVKTWDDLYSMKTWDDTLWDIVNRIKWWQWTIKDYNDLARFYNSEFKNKIYTKTWEAKDSIVADRYEINRTWIKKFVREKLWDDTLRQLDQDYSNAASTKYLIDKAAEWVNKLEQKLKERWLWYRAFRWILNLVDKTTLWWTKAIRDYFITSNVWNKVNNWIDIQSELKKNIKLLNNALNKPNKWNLQRLDEFLWKVTWVKPKEVKYSFKEKPFTPKWLLPKWNTIPEAPKMVSKDKIKVETPQLSKKQIKNLIKQKKEETKQINNWWLKPKQQLVVKEWPQVNKKQEDNKIWMKPKSSTERVTELIQKDREKRGIKFQKKADELVDRYNNKFDWENPRFWVQRFKADISKKEVRRDIRKYSDNVWIKTVEDKYKDKAIGYYQKWDIFLNEKVTKDTWSHEVVHFYKDVLDKDEMDNLINEVIRDKSITKEEVALYNKQQWLNKNIKEYAEEALADWFYNFLKGKPTWLSWKIFQKFLDFYKYVTWKITKRQLRETTLQNKFYNDIYEWKNKWIKYKESNWLKSKETAFQLKEKWLKPKQEIDEFKSFNNIKNKSESYAKLMRDTFPASFEDKKLNKILNEIVFDDEKSIFANTLKEQKLEEQFKWYIYNKLDLIRETKSINKTAKELLNEKWYDLHITKTEVDVAQFKKYYKKWEELCTFNNIEGRLKDFDIYWITKKDIDKIDHKWKNASRQDEYWTSCCSIQISKRWSDISIKNRYNHTVGSPDNTFNNNLENIIEWLTESFNKDFWLSISKKQTSNFEVKDFIFIKDKFMYFNNEFDWIYYWINKIFDWTNIITYSKDKYVLAENFLIDKNTWEVKNLVINKEFFNKDELQIKTNNKNQVIEVTGNVSNLWDHMFKYNKNIKTVNLPKLKSVWRNFLYFNEILTEINLPILESAWSYFLDFNENLININLPKLKSVWNSFLNNNQNITEINLPNLETVWDGFLYENRNLINVDLPNLKSVWDDFLWRNTRLENLNIPNLKSIWYNFLQYGEFLIKVNSPNLETVWDSFLRKNMSLQKLNLPNLKSVWDDFLSFNKKLTEINLPKLKSVWDSFLANITNEDILDFKRK